MPAVGVAQRKVHLGKASEQTGSIPVAGAKVQRSLTNHIIFFYVFFATHLRRPVVFGGLLDEQA